jgi:hypothetical protein
MSNPQISAAGERLAVGVAAPLGEFATVQTRLTIERWDEEQTQWALSRARDALGRYYPEVSRRDFAVLGVQPYSVTVDENCNLVTEQGWAALLGGTAGTSPSLKFSAAAARIGIGTSATAATGADTKLTGDTGGASTTSFYKLVSGAPTISTAAAVATLVFAATFGTAQANFAWAEFGTDNGSADSVTITPTTPIFLNHGVSAQGTKASGQTWTATETLSFGFPSGSGTVS